MATLVQTKGACESAQPLAQITIPIKVNFPDKERVEKKEEKEKRDIWSMQWSQQSQAQLTIPKRVNIPEKERRERGKEEETHCSG